jgi:hypothetical protein
MAKTTVSGKGRWIRVTLTALSILAGLPWGAMGCLFLPLLVCAQIRGDSWAGHWWQFFIVSVVTALVGGGSVMIGIYTLIVTKGFKRWGSDLSRINKAVAYVAMMGIVWNVPFWRYALLLWRAGGLW